jgi:hypothetical protein
MTASHTIAVNKDLGWDIDRVNVNGGAIALGHPIGASGNRVLVTLLHEMQKRDAKKGLATLCIGGGMGIALCVEQAGLSRSGQLGSGQLGSGGDEDGTGRVGDRRQPRHRGCDLEGVEPGTQERLVRRVRQAGGMMLPFMEGRLIGRGSATAAMPISDKSSGWSGE